MENRNVVQADLYRRLATHYNSLADVEEFDRPVNERRARLRASGYSLGRALGAMQEGAFARDAPAEAEASARIAAEIGREPAPGCFFVPTSQRDLTVASVTAAGYLVGTDHAPGDVFVGAMTAASLLDAFNVQRIPCVGSGHFPRISTGPTSTWLTSESAAIAESTPTAGEFVATPKSVGVYVEVSRQFLRQTTPAAQSFLMQELGRQAAAAVDAAVIGGSGAAGQPRGLLLTPGVGSETGTSFSWAKACGMINDCEVANAALSPATAGWAIAPDVALLLRQRERITTAGRFIFEDGMLAGYRVVVSNAVPAGALVFGDWRSLALATWGTLELGVDPYGAALFKTGIAGLRAIVTIDVIVLLPEGFSISTSIT